MSEKYSFERSLGMLTMQISRGVGKRLVENLTARGYNIEPIEWSAISYLNKFPDCNQQDIANFLWISKVKVKRLLDKLESTGLVSRQLLPTDKRNNVVRLTSKGEAFYCEAINYANSAFDMAYRGITQEEQQELLDLLVKVKANLS